MYHFRVDIPSGTQITEPVNANISFSDSNNIGTASIQLYNPAGTYSGTFNVGDNVIAYAGANSADKLSSFDGGISGGSYTTGIVGSYAMTFTGSPDHVYVIEDGLLNFDYTDSYSISFWVNTTVNAGSDVSISEHWVSGQGYPWAIRNIGGFGIYDGTNNPKVSFGAGWQNGSDHHFVCIKDATEDLLKVYRDNSLIGTTVDTTTSSTKSTANAFSIGARTEVVPVYFFPGTIDEFRIYNKAINRSEVNTLYNKNDVSSNLVAKYSFEEGAGTTAEDTAISGVKIFNGFIHSQRFQSYQEGQERLTLTCLDYTARLAESTHNASYSNLSAGSIVKAIIAEDINDITTTNVDDGKTIEHIAFRAKPILDCIRELAQFTNYDYYVDVDKDLHFAAKRSVYSGKELRAGSDITDANVTEDRNTMWNSIYVYGGRRLVGYAQSGVGDGAGSVFTLTYNPHNTFVTVSGAEKRGGIFQMVSTPSSGQEYLINYDDKEIIFTSGTVAGMNIPGSLVEWKCDYQRLVPVAKYIQDQDSKAQYGEREYIVVNEEIVQPRHAEQVAKSLLDEFRVPKESVRIDIYGHLGLVPTETVGVVLPYTNVSGQYVIRDVNYDINTDTLASEEIMNLTVGARTPDITDAIKNAYLELQLLKARPIATADVITRMMAWTGSETLGIYSWEVKTKSIGSSFILGHPVNGVLGSENNIVLGSATRGAWTIQTSGGDYA